MDYSHITCFLDKFKKIIFQKEETKEAIVKTISDKISYQIDSNSVKTKGGCIYVEGSPILRSEILMNKKQILTTLENILPNNHFFDIK